MGKDAKGQPFRAFSKDEGFQNNRTTYGVDTLYRYEDHFLDPDTALEHFADVPFLNGGLFECLDRIEEGTNKKLYLDGFSRNAKSAQPSPTTSSSAASTRKTFRVHTATPSTRRRRFAAFFTS